MRTQFFSGIISKITVLFCVFGFIGITGFHYLNTHNQGYALLASDEVKVQKKALGSYIHIRKPGESGFRTFGVGDI